MRKSKKEKKVHKIKESVIESFQLPKDLMLGAPIVTVTGYQEAYIENYRGILEYTECLIVLQTKVCQIVVGGEGLHVEYYTNDDMKIHGCITDIRYMNFS